MPSGGGKTDEDGKGFLNQVIIPISISIAIIAAIYHFYTRRRGEKILTEDEEAIIDFIKSRGGKAYLKEIREGLEIPSSTAWRKVRRLEKMGLVKIYRTPAGLVVKLR